MRLLHFLPVIASINPLASGMLWTLCQKYTEALFVDNTPANQYQLLIRLVNTVVIGNYTQPNTRPVAGILADGKFGGQSISLLKYFDGSLVDVNNGGVKSTKPGVQNFLDDGGAAPLLENLPSYHNDTAQYFLLTHLYQFFGVLLGCDQGNADFPNYGGTPSMFSVHKFMSLTHNEIGYFNTQVKDAALSFGVSTADANTVYNLLQSSFNYKCLPAEMIVPYDGKQLQSICAHSSCPVDNSAPYSNCASYPNGGVEPFPAAAPSASPS